MIRHPMFVNLRLTDDAEAERVDFETSELPCHCGESWSMGDCPKHSHPGQPEIQLGIRDNWTLVDPGAFLSGSNAYERQIIPPESALRPDVLIDILKWRRDGLRLHNASLGLPTMPGRYVLTPFMCGQATVSDIKSLLQCAKFTQDMRRDVLHWLYHRTNTSPLSRSSLGIEGFLLNHMYMPQIACIAVTAVSAWEASCAQNSLHTADLENVLKDQALFDGQNFFDQSIQMGTSGFISTPESRQLCINVSLHEDGIY